MEKFKIKTGFSDNPNNQTIFTPDNKELHCQILSVQKRRVFQHLDVVTGLRVFEDNLMIEFSLPICAGVGVSIDCGQFVLITGESKHIVNDIEFSNGLIYIEAAAEIIP